MVKVWRYCEKYIETCQKTGSLRHISPTKKKENDVSNKNLHTSADSIHMQSLIEIVWLGFEIVSFSGGGSG